MEVRLPKICVLHSSNPFLRPLKLPNRNACSNMLLVFCLKAIWALSLHVARFTVHLFCRLAAQARSRIFFRFGLESLTTASTAHKVTPASAGSIQVLRFSRCPSSMKPEYDVVVVGSGYGGGVAASRFARAGKTVCVLERGPEKWPGEYPRTFKDALRKCRVSGTLAGITLDVGTSDALYNTVKGRGQDICSGSGLGGTSLVNGGVFLRPDERVLQKLEWPEQIRTASDTLDPYFARAERMFQPQPFPSTRQAPVKLATLREQAQRLDLMRAFYYPPLTTFFQAGTNAAGVHVQENQGSGSECTGNNDGSKNSVLVTYIADAWARGAEIFCGTEVRSVQPAKTGKGYSVYFRHTGERGQSRIAWVKARDLVVLGAGTLGTTEILLRSQREGLSTSPLLGQHLSGNGDMLAFAYNCAVDLNSVASDPIGIVPAARCGPTITGCIDLRDAGYAKAVNDGFIIQDGTIPEALGPVAQALLESRGDDVTTTTHQRLRGMVAKATSWILGPLSKSGSVRRTSVFLVMSHDDDQGTIELENDKISVRWTGPSNKQRHAKIDTVLRALTEGLGGVLVKAPRITVHPLGGAVMSHDSCGLGGVVNHCGQLFAGVGSETHRGIVCMDASIIPTSLGVNPCATITALAERACDLAVQDRGWIVDEFSDVKADACDDPPSSLFTEELQGPTEGLQSKCEGVKFSEIMEGYVHVGTETMDHMAAVRLAKANSCAARLDVKIDALRMMDGSYRGTSSGTLMCGALSSSALLITRGKVKFFVPDTTVADRTRLVYKFSLLSIEGKAYNFCGFKKLDSAVTLSIAKTWSAMTTLYTTITASDGSVVARGILRIQPASLLRTIIFMRTRTEMSFLQSFQAQLRYMKFFAKNIAAYTFSPFRPLQYPTMLIDHSQYIKKPLASTIRVTSDDGVTVSMRVWHPPAGIPQKQMPIVLIPGAAVDDQIFSLPTLPTNTIDYFTALGYRCYVPVLRFGSGEAGRRGDTAYDARLDVKAAMISVRKQEQGRQAYVVAHCLGSIAMALALLTGDVKAQWINGMTCSQVFTNLVLSKDNEIKAWSRLTKIYEILAGRWFPCHSSPSSPMIQYLLDQLLRFYPVGSRREICNSTVCHRCNVPFGRCWNHANLNRATHSHLDQFFDGVHTNFVTHLSRMGVTEPRHVRTNLPAFENLVIPENLWRLEGIKINFLSGSDNAVWSIKSTKDSYDLLRDTFPDGRYERTVVKDYGHLDCWMGKNAYRDVYPRVEHHVEFCQTSVE
ncbi:hypothetical protein BKA63DRAFT_513049 [Paraphoma chrysanthemicola]|nr:hypothetical protein BKA63DRAFT_513049 [Paraphoma chrysanthemicola]